MSTSYAPRPLAAHVGLLSAPARQIRDLCAPGALEDWTPEINSALEAQLAKQPVGKGPLAEIEFWRARSAALSTLCEQLNTPNARRMLEVLERVRADSPRAVVAGTTGRGWGAFGEAGGTGWGNKNQASGES
eukprot:459070-Pleurochrysis_carterae.AAC.1